MKRLALLLAIVAVLAARCAAESPAIEVASPHFTLITDAGERQARQIVDNFERMRWMFQTLFPKLDVDPAEPMVIVAVKSKKEFQALEPADYLAKGQINLAGYFLSSSDKHYILLRLDGESTHPFSTVYHEYTHLQFRPIGNLIPLWLNEGMAEFFQNTEFHEKQVQLGEPSVDDILYLRQNSLIPLATLFRVDHNSPYYHEENKGSIFYSESWALTHYLEITDRQKGTKRLSDYMVRTVRHEDPVTAAEAAFGDLKTLQRQLEGYIRAQQYMQFVLNSAVAPADSNSYRVTRLSPAELTAHRADVLAHVGRTSEASALIDGLGASGTQLPEAFDTLGFLAWRAGDMGAARSAYEKAIQLGSRNFFVYFNSANLARFGENNDTKVEANLRKAVELNPSFAAAVDDLSQWVAHHGDRLDEARSLSLKAIQLSPGNLYYRVHAADILLQQNKPDEAEHTLRLARSVASTSGETSMIDSRIADIVAMRTSLRVLDSGRSSDAQPAEPKVLTVDVAPRHPVEPAAGPRHTVLGAMARVQCAYPSAIELDVEPKATAKAVHLYASDYTRIDLTAAGFDPGDNMNPCHDFDGRTAKVVYADSSDKTVDGQVVSIELHK